MRREIRGDLLDESFSRGPSQKARRSEAPGRRKKGLPGEEGVMEAKRLEEEVIRIVRFDSR